MKKPNIIIITPHDTGYHARMYGYQGEAIEYYLAMLQGAVRKADEGVGIILSALEAAGLEDDTLVLFAVDHGIEGGRSCPWMLSNADFVPTLAEMIGVTPAHEMEGTSFVRAFEPRVDLSGPGPREHVYAMWSETGQYPHEEHDVADDPAHAAALEEMNACFYEWLDATGDPIRFGPTPTPYYKDAISDYERHRPNNPNRVGMDENPNAQQKGRPDETYRQ